MIYNSMQTAEEQRRVRAEHDTEVAALQTAITEMAQAHRAATDWTVQLLNGETVRLSEIMTVELERAWLHRNILFYGQLVDIASVDDDHYSVTIASNYFGRGGEFLVSPLQLSLQAEKSRIDRFLADSRVEMSNNGYSNGIAVVARIDRIDRTQRADFEGQPEEVTVGLGELIDWTYYGRRLLE